MRYLYIFILSLIVGLIIGKYTGVEVGGIYEITLYILIFLVGMDLGTGNIHEFKKAGKASLILPLLTIIGSLIGGFWGGFLLHIPIKWSLAITAGCGWYSLAGPLVTQYSPLYGAMAFITNLIRELVMILLFPFAVRKVPGKILVFIGGAGTMDSTLGIVKKFGTREDALVSFVHGFIVTIAVMSILPLILQI